MLQAAALAEAAHADALRSALASEQATLVQNEHSLVVQSTEFRARSETLASQQLSIVASRRGADEAEATLTVGLHNMRRGESELRAKRALLAEQMDELQLSRSEAALKVSFFSLNVPLQCVRILLTV